ncbi:hypothetical protein T5B8_11077 [Salinisphaera sp. T5B8]|uniref:hypothetical protein n=1 Tax=Salinisphaera sp. T5B8 TaxID=1304154 RepID=UPI00334168C1
MAAAIARASCFNRVGFVPQEEPQITQMKKRVAQAPDESDDRGFLSLICVICVDLRTFACR